MGKRKITISKLKKNKKRTRKAGEPPAFKPPPPPVGFKGLYKPSAEIKNEYVEPIKERIHKHHHRRHNKELEGIIKKTPEEMRRLQNMVLESQTKKNSTLKNIDNSKQTSSVNTTPKKLNSNIIVDENMKNDLI